MSPELICVSEAQFCGYSKQKLVAMATSLFEQSEPNFTAISYARGATNPENSTKTSPVDLR